MTAGGYYAEAQCCLNLRSDKSSPAKKSSSPSPGKKSNPQPPPTASPPTKAQPAPITITDNSVNNSNNTTIYNYPPEAAPPVKTFKEQPQEEPVVKAPKEPDPIVPPLVKKGNPWPWVVLGSVVLTGAGGTIWYLSTRPKTNTTFTSGTRPDPNQQPNGGPPGQNGIQKPSGPGPNKPIQQQNAAINVLVPVVSFTL